MSLLFKNTLVFSLSIFLNLKYEAEISKSDLLTLEFGEGLKIWTSKLSILILFCFLEIFLTFTSIGFNLGWLYGKE